MINKRLFEIVDEIVAEKDSQKKLALVDELNKLLAEEEDAQRKTRNAKS